MLDMPKMSVLTSSLCHDTRCMQSLTISTRNAAAHLTLRHSRSQLSMGKQWRTQLQLRANMYRPRVSLEKTINLWRLFGGWGIRSNWREPPQTQGDHANSSQKGKRVRRLSVPELWSLYSWEKCSFWCTHSPLHLKKICRAGVARQRSLMGLLLTM